MVRGGGDGGQGEGIYTHHAKHKLGSVFKLRAFASPAAEGIWGRGNNHSALWFVSWTFQISAGAVPGLLKCSQDLLFCISVCICIYTDTSEMKTALQSCDLGCLQQTRQHTEI